MTSKNWIPLLALGLILASCLGDDLDGPVCTEEYRYVTLEVSGDTLTDYFTVWPAHADTFRFEQPPLFTDTTIIYPVLSDYFQPFLEGTTSQFNFVGVVGDSVRIDKTYVVGADLCHIYAVEGPVRVDI